MAAGRQIPGPAGNIAHDILVSEISEEGESLGLSLGQSQTANVQVNEYEWSLTLLCI
jgi:hypothetical protein